jgi:hypothetical protein
LRRRNVDKFLKPEGNFLKNLSMFRQLSLNLKLIINPKKGQRILGYDKDDTETNKEQTNKKCHLHFHTQQ